MKEHFQDYGARKWAGDDLIELQSEPLAALQALVSPYAPCIVSGCETHADDGGGYTVSAGLVALPGKDVKGNDCVKIVRTDSIAMADNNQVCYLTLSHQTITRTYGDGQSKAIAYNYVAQQTTIKPEDTPYLEIAANGGRRLVDTLGITQKLDREGGDATDVKVTFADPSADQEPEPLKSNTKLGTLISQIKGWLSALKALAFKEKVAKDDLDANLTKELNDKVDKVNGKGLSTNDFTDALKNKLDGFTHSAGGDLDGDYPNPQIKESVSLRGTPTAPTPPNSDNSTRIATTAHVHSYAAKVDHTHTEASPTTAGFMSIDDKNKLDGIAKNANNFTYTHPTGNGNNHIPAGGKEGQYLKYSSSGTATWEKPTASEIGAAASSHSHTLSSLGAASTNAATTSTAGLMSAADKTKLDGIAKNANNFTYTHPTSSGNKHIPSGGSLGNFLKYSTDGTATWGVVCDYKGDISSSIVIGPGMIVQASGDFSVLLQGATTTKLAVNNVSYVGCSASRKISISKSGSVKICYTPAAWAAKGVAKSGLWRFTWTTIGVVFVEFNEWSNYE